MPPTPEAQAPINPPDARSPFARFLITVYKTTLSPAIHLISPSRCRYLPTCSEYAYVAIARFGLIHGTYLALHRLLRCHPLSEGGLDPVPPRS